LGVGSYVTVSAVHVPTSLVAVVSSTAARQTHNQTAITGAFSGRDHAARKEGRDRPQTQTLAGHETPSIRAVARRLQNELVGRREGREDSALDVVQHLSADLHSDQTPRWTNERWNQPATVALAVRTHSITENGPD